MWKSFDKMKTNMSDNRGASLNEFFMVKVKAKSLSSVSLYQNQRLILHRNTTDSFDKI